MLKREFKINLKSLIVWTSIVALMLIMVFCVYPYMDTEGAITKIDEMMEMFPKEVLEAFNMDAFSLSTVFGWIKTEGYIFIILLGSIYSALLGSSILSNEEKYKTIEFLASKPVKRKDIVTSKIICMVTHIFLFNLLVFLVQLIGLSLSNELEIGLLLKMSISPLLLYYIMAFLTLAISTMLKSSKRTTAVALLISFIPYMFQLVGTISDKVSILRKISFYEFISLRYLVDKGHINYIYLGIGLFIIIVSIFLTYKAYDKKELV